jgi:hypothetical protein
MSSCTSPAAIAASINSSQKRPNADTGAVAAGHQYHSSTPVIRYLDAIGNRGFEREVGLELLTDDPASADKGFVQCWPCGEAGWFTESSLDLCGQMTTASQSRYPHVHKICWKR